MAALIPPGTLAMFQDHGYGDPGEPPAPRRLVTVGKVWDEATGAGYDVYPTCGCFETWWEQLHPNEGPYFEYVDQTSIQAYADELEVVW